MRLRRPEDFRKVWSDGRTWAHRLFIVRALPNNMDHTRIGITASRKVGNAVARNRARRLLREAARHLYGELTAGWDIVLLARSGLLQVKTPVVERELRAVLDREDLLKAPSTVYDVTQGEDGVD
jgi:ribonuclease P protein component